LLLASIILHGLAFASPSEHISLSFGDPRVY
jgi:hypothetical protein